MTNSTFAEIPEDREVPENLEVVEGANPNYTPVKTIDEEFTRCNHTPNAEGLTQIEIEQRDRDTAEMMKLYPKLNPLWADMIWNFVHRTPKERIKEIIENKEFEGKPTKEYLTGGILKSGSIEDKPSVVTKEDEYYLERSGEEV